LPGGLVAGEGAIALLCPAVSPGASLEVTFISLAMQRAVVVRALKTSLLVGVILVAINHADALVRGDLDLVRIAKIVLTFMVPYCVSTYASVSTMKHMNS
jgi:hypothetical protein